MRWLDSNEYELKNIHLEYIVGDAGIMDSYLHDIPNTIFRYQNDFIGCLDFKINYNSINILSKATEHTSFNRFNPYFGAVYDDVPEIDCSIYPTMYRSTIYTAPLEDYEVVGDVVTFHTNVISLKDNFTENGKVACNDRYRKYTKLNFGEFMFDDFDPAILYRTDFNLEFVLTNKDEFTFKIPDLYPDTPINLATDYVCNGCIASNDQQSSDLIKWYDDDGEHIEWFYNGGGNGKCDGFWCSNGTTDVSTCVFSAGDEYTYVRTPITKESMVDSELTGGSSNLLFVQGALSGSLILDKTDYQHDGKFV